MKLSSALYDKYKKSQVEYINEEKESQAEDINKEKEYRIDKFNESIGDLYYIFDDSIGDAYYVLDKLVFKDASPLSDLTVNIQEARKWLSALSTMIDEVKHQELSKMLYDLEGKAKAIEFKFSELQGNLRDFGSELRNIGNL